MRLHVATLSAAALALASCDTTPDIDCTIDGSIGGQARAWYADADEDGFGDPSSAALACEAPDGWVDNARDCDDADDAVHPDAPELCNGRDDDCDQDADEGVLTTWYFDGDADGWGSSVTTTSCAAPLGYVSAPDDCDDRNPAVHPTAEELCDGLDTDCDPRTAETINLTCYPDADGDDYGDPASPTPTCDAQCPVGFVLDATDCDDDAEDAYPGADELCDALDNDCDPLTFPDEGAECFGATPALNPANGHVYLMFDSANNFGGAGNVCGQRGYHLAWLDDAAEAAYVEGLADDAGNPGALWVGVRWDACGQTGPFRRVDDRTSPDSCAPVSAYEASLLTGLPESGGATLADGALGTANPGNTLLWYVCEAEP